MTKVSYISVLPTIESDYYSALKISDRFTVARVAVKKTIFSRRRVNGLTQKSLLPQIATAWKGLTLAQHTAWTNAGVPRKLNGYRLFVSDMCARIKNGISGIATPSLLHQSWVGKIVINSPAHEIQLSQIHPSSYWVSQPVHGAKGQRQPVQVFESFSLPLVLSLNYKSNLTSVGAGSFAKFYADIWYGYQGVNFIKTLEIPLDFVADWKNATATLSSLESIVIGYTLYFHIYNMTGILYIDNVKATHNGQNWVRDTYCDDIAVEFTKAFYQIPKNWSPTILPTGAEYDTVYEDF